MRIAIIGPQNTGKTTFIQDFLREFKSYTTPKEKYRDIISKNKLKINQNTNDKSQELIGSFLFKNIKNTTGKNVVFDRCVIDNYIYSSLGYRAKKVSKDLLLKTEKLMLENLRYLDCIVFIPTAVSVRLKADNIRDIDTQFVDEVNDAFITTLLDIRSKYFIPVFVISGNRKQRIEKIKRILS